MASGDTALSICSDALILLGAAPLSSFTEGSASAQACDRLYPDLRDNMISRYPWSWSLIKLKLNRLVDAPTNEFKYQYQLPGSMLSGVLALFSSGSSSAMSLNSGWEIYGESVFTNLEEVYIDYQASIDESKFPPYFVRLLRTAMAAELAVVITDQVSTTVAWPSEPRPIMGAAVYSEKLLTLIHAVSPMRLYRITLYLL